MTLDKLREIERSLMRTAFEKACLLSGLTLDPREAVNDNELARIAATVQTLVESGVSDLELIAGRASEFCRK